MKRELRITFVAFFGFCGVARAGPVLLASFDIQGGSAHAPEMEQRVEIFLELRPFDADPPGFRLGENTFWSEGDQGILEFSAFDTTDFLRFADIATNGVNDRYLQYTLWPSGTGSAQGGFESRLFGREPALGELADLSGYQLDLVRLSVRNVHFEPWPMPDPTGFQVTYDLTYEFYGTPIPEVGTLVFLVSGGMVTLMGRHMR